MSDATSLALADGPGDKLSSFRKRVAPFLQRHCVKCHRDGGVGPFRLDSYEDVVSHAPMIREVITRGVMPPWFAATDNHAQVSPWSNDASLTPVEKRDLLAWIEGDQAAGDPAEAPRDAVIISNCAVTVRS